MYLRIAKGLWYINTAGYYILKKNPVVQTKAAAVYITASCCRAKIIFTNECPSKCLSLSYGGLRVVY